MKKAYSVFDLFGVFSSQLILLVNLLLTFLLPLFGLVQLPFNRGLKFRHSKGLSCGNPASIPCHSPRRCPVARALSDVL